MSLLLLLRDNESVAPGPSYALDSQTTDLISAWSIRKLLASYAGSCIRVRRSSDSTEQDIGFVGEDFDDASYTSFVGGGTGFLRTWYDQSGAGRNFEQATTARQPRINLSYQNGKPMIQFLSASVNYMTVPSNKTAFNAFHNSGAGGTLYIVSKVEDAAPLRMLLATASETTGRGFYLYRNASEQLFVGAFNAVQKATLTATPGAIVAAVNTVFIKLDEATAANRITAYQDGTLMGGTTAGIAGGSDGDASYDLVVGHQGNLSTLPLNGWVSEIALWSGNKQSNRAIWEDNAQAYWGTP